MNQMNEFDRIRDSVRRILRNLDKGGPGKSKLRRVHERFACMDGIVPPREAHSICRALDRRYYPYLKPLTARIPRDALRGMKENYGELLPKTMRLRTAMLEKPRAADFRALQKLGIAGLLRDPNLQSLAERVLGLRLVPNPGLQVICYGPGDYSGPHNDHHPEDVGFRHGYVDVHVTLSGPSVKSQELVVERDGYFTESVEVGVPSAISFYHLPFWHYTTPLLSRPRARSAARRWLLLATFEINRRKTSSLKRA